jgi:hypothetical protein
MSIASVPVIAPGDARALGAWPSAVGPLGGGPSTVLYESALESELKADVLSDELLVRISTLTSSTSSSSSRSGVESVLYSSFVPSVKLVL